jgi:hypothetical protein
VHGNLLSPQDLAGLIEPLGLFPAVAGGWLLDGNLHPDIYEVLKRESLLLFAQSSLYERRVELCVSHA